MSLETECPLCGNEQHIGHGRACLGCGADIPTEYDKIKDKEMKQETVEKKNENIAHHKDLPLPCGVNYKSCIAAIFWICFAVAIVGALAAVLIVQDAAASPLLDGVYTPQQVHEQAQSHVFGAPHPRHDIRERGDGHVDGYPARVHGLPAIEIDGGQ